MGARQECFKQNHFIENPTGLPLVSIGMNSNIKPLVSVTEIYRKYNLLSGERYCVKNIIGFSDCLPNHEGRYRPRLAYRDEGGGSVVSKSSVSSFLRRIFSPSYITGGLSLPSLNG